MQTRTSSTAPSQEAFGHYFPHIDGIRALAILPVLVYHVTGFLCPGGFAGVDVFFVISGYLITGGILRDFGKNKFTIRGFYHRRIRRILPAYFTVLVCIFIVGCIVFYSTMLVHLSDSSVMGTLFSANIYAWREGGNYFAAETHQNPLLHLWSLGVEEQFYFFIPILCATIWKVRSRLIVPVFSLIAAGSLAAALWAMSTGKQNSAFYLLQYRAWELLLGSLLAMAPGLPKGDPGVRLGASVRIKNEYFAWLGLILVLVPYYTLSPTSPFPGLTALSPVFGAALMIRYGQAGPVSRLLGSRFFVFIGKISYSLYLWHWPVTVFWRYVTYDHLYFLDYVGMYVVSLALGYLSWRLVELPVRNSPRWTMKRSFAFAISGIAVLVTVGTFCLFSRGWSGVLHAQANRHVYVPPKIVETMVASKVRQFQVLTGLPSDLSKAVLFSNGGEGDSQVGLPGHPPDYYLIGDSHAGALQLGFDILSKQTGQAGLVSTVFGTKLYDPGNPETRHFFKKLAEHPEISKIILATYWHHNDRPQDFQLLREFAKHVQQLNKTLYIIQDVPYYETSPCEMTARLKIIAPRVDAQAKYEGTFQTGQKYDELQSFINSQIQDIGKSCGATVIPLNLAFKQGDIYVTEGDIDGRSCPLYADKNHLSPYGSLLAARFILPYVYPSGVALGKAAGLKEVMSAQ